MSTENFDQKKKDLLGSIFSFYLKNSDFPEKRSFRVNLSEGECDLLDKLESKKYFSESSNDREKYVLRLKSVAEINNAESKELLKIGNALLPIFKKFYEKDFSENKYWTVDEISAASGFKKDDVEKILFFLTDLYLYFRGHQEDSKNRYVFKAIGLDERIRWAKSIEEFIEDYLTEKKKTTPLLLGNVENIVKAEYGPDKLVAFLDVLGFKEIIKKKENAERYFNSITTILKNIENTQSKKEIQYALISDSVVLSFPFEGDLRNVNEFFIALGRIQAELCLQDIWLRGAVTIGGIKMENVENNRVVFGPALSSAYTMELNHAKFPRILLDPTIFQKVMKTREELMGELRVLNSNAELFDNILFDPSVSAQFADGRQVPGTNIKNDGVWVNYFEIIRKDKVLFNKFAEYLKTHLYEGQEHFEKYKWVHSYALLEFSSRGMIYDFDKDFTFLASF